MPKHYFSDPMVAWWMAARHGLRLVDATGADADPGVWPVGDTTEVFYVHPRSAPLLEPRPGDVLRGRRGGDVLAVVAGDHGAVAVPPGAAARLVRDGYRIVQRDGIPFFSPAAEPDPETPTVAWPRAADRRSA